MVWFMARLTDGCDIPKPLALQSCIFPVAKYCSVAKHFVSGLIISVSRGRYSVSLQPFSESL